MKITLRVDFLKITAQTVCILARSLTVYPISWLNQTFFIAKIPKLIYNMPSCSFFVKSTTDVEIAAQSVFQPLFKYYCAMLSIPSIREINLFPFQYFIFPY